MPPVFRLPVGSVQPLRLPRELFRQDLDRHVALELGIASAVNLAHASFPDKRRDLIGPEFLANGERHARSILGERFQGCNEVLTSAIRPASHAEYDDKRQPKRSCA